MRTFQASRYGIEQCGQMGHHWKELRSKNKMTKTTFHFFKHCVNCPAVIETVIGHVTTPEGEVVPRAKMYFIGIQETAEMPVEVEESQMEVSSAGKGEGNG